MTTKSKGEGELEVQPLTCKAETQLLRDVLTRALAAADDGIAKAKLRKIPEPNLERDEERREFLRKQRDELLAAEGQGEV